MGQEMPVRLPGNAACAGSVALLSGFRITTSPCDVRHRRVVSLAGKHPAWGVWSRPPRRGRWGRTDAGAGRPAPRGGSARGRPAHGPHPNHPPHTRRGLLLVRPGPRCHRWRDVVRPLRAPRLAQARSRLMNCGGGSCSISGADRGGARPASTSVTPACSIQRQRTIPGLVPATRSTRRRHKGHDEACPDHHL